jgi:hypothetical protein
MEKKEIIDKGKESENRQKEKKVRTDKRKRK